MFWGGLGRVFSITLGHENFEPFVLWKTQIVRTTQLVSW